MSGEYDSEIADAEGNQRPSDPFGLPAVENRGHFIDGVVSDCNGCHGAS